MSTNQELNESSEQLINSLKNYSLSSEDIERYTYNGNEIIGSSEKSAEYRVYNLKIPLNSQLVEQTKQINSFYFVPYMYINMKNYPFNYNTSGMLSLANDLSIWIIYAAMILAIFLMVLIVFFL